MKKYLALITLFITNITAFADWDTGILWWIWTWDDWVEKLREWDIHLDDIPNMIKFAIDYLLGFAWTVSIIFIIIWAYQFLFGSVTNEKTKWRDTIIMALWGFVVASLSWFIINFILSNFTL